MTEVYIGDDGHQYGEEASVVDGESDDLVLYASDSEEDAFY